jgi:hypothetical protein
MRLIGLFICSAFEIIILQTHYEPSSSSMNLRPFRHGQIDSVFILLVCMRKCAIKSLGNLPFMHIYKSIERKSMLECRLKRVS